MLFTWLGPTGAPGFFRVDIINFVGAEIRVINSWEKYFEGYRLNLEYCRIFMCLVAVLNQRWRDDDLTRSEGPPDRMRFFFLMLSYCIMSLIIISKKILSIEMIYIFPYYNNSNANYFKRERKKYILRKRNQYLMYLFPFSAKRKRRRRGWERKRKQRAFPYLFSIPDLWRVCIYAIKRRRLSVTREKIRMV